MRPFTKNIHKCLTCGQEFSVHAYRTAKGEGKYCSVACSSIARRMEKSWAWKGGRFFTKGYWWLTLPKARRFPEHRYIMEQTLGRELLQHERVYHINGIKSDNTPSNLSLTPPKRKFFRTKLPDGDTRPLEPVEP